MLHQGVRGKAGKSQFQQRIAFIIASGCVVRGWCGNALETIEIHHITGAGMVMVDFFGAGSHEILAGFHGRGSISSPMVRANDG
jgi:hypothetical protein